MFKNLRFYLICGFGSLLLVVWLIAGAAQPKNRPTEDQVAQLPDQVVELKKDIVELKKAIGNIEKNCEGLVLFQNKLGRMSGGSPTINDWGTELSDLLLKYKDKLDLIERLPKRCDVDYVTIDKMVGTYDIEVLQPNVPIDLHIPAGGRDYSWSFPQTGKVLMAWLDWPSGPPTDMFYSCQATPAGNQVVVMLHAIPNRPPGRAIVRVYAIVQKS
jgi:hypothetical protein